MWAIFEHPPDGLVIPICIFLFLFWSLVSISTFWSFEFCLSSSPKGSQKAAIKVARGSAISKADRNNRETTEWAPKGSQRETKTKPKGSQRSCTGQCSFQGRPKQKQPKGRHKGAKTNRSAQAVPYFRAIAISAADVRRRSLKFWIPYFPFKCLDTPWQVQEQPTNIKYM